MKIKEFCNTCQLFINPDNHELRCKPKKEKQTSEWNNQRTEAWINDAVLQLDVQLGLLRKGVPSNELSLQLQKLVSNENLAAVWRHLGDTTDLAQPTGSSDHNLGTAFECNYKNTFRQRILTMWFGKDIAKYITDTNPGITGTIKVKRS